MREIALDTETTGLNPRDGHRIIEIGCVELHNHVPTGRTFHTYINPERDVPREASAVSGITTEFLKPHPLFHTVVQDFLSFIGEDVLVIHNAKFDLGFINAEFERLAISPIPLTRSVDTVLLARKKFPGSPANLDALCKRFNIDLSGREKHGALIDAKLLAEVYLELKGGRQRSLDIAKNQVRDSGEPGLFAVTREVLKPRLHEPKPEELEKHKDFIKKLKNPLWEKWG